MEQNIKKALRLAMEIEKHFEGWSSEVYICPGGYPTIGYGHRCSVDHPPIDSGQGEAYLLMDNQTALNGVTKYCPILLPYPEKMGAIIDFTFNLGVGNLWASTLRKKINEGDWEASKKELSRWVYAKGKKLPGLIARRAVEAALMGDNA